MPLRTLHLTLLPYPARFGVGTQKAEEEETATYHSIGLFVMRRVAVGCGRECRGRPARPHAARAPKCAQALLALRAGRLPLQLHGAPVRAQGLCARSGAPTSST